MIEVFPKLTKIEGIKPAIEDNRGLEKIMALVAFARELSESRESFPFPGIDPERYAKMKADDIEFPGLATPVDDLLNRLRAEGMQVALGEDAETGNVYILPAGEGGTTREDKYIFPRDLQFVESTNEKIRRLVQMDIDKNKL